MAEPISIQQLKDASEDAISLAEFINKPENVMIPRRLASDINSLQYYLDYMSSYAQHSYETYDEMVANAPNLPNGVSAFVTNDLDTPKNGIYTYNGTSFVKGEYQPENAAKEFVESKLGGLEVFDGKVRAQDVVDDSLSQRTINKGLESTTDLSTIINPKDGLRVYVKSYHAGFGKGGGYFIYDSSKASVNDGGVVINGWVRAEVDAATPEMFGAKADGVADDSDAFDAALSMSKKISLTGKDYRLTRPIKTSGHNISGSSPSDAYSQLGTKVTFDLSENARFCMVFDRKGSVDNVHFRMSEQSWLAGVKAHGARFLRGTRFENVVFDSFTRSGVVVYSDYDSGGASPYKTLFDTCTFCFCGEHNIIVAAGGNTVYFNNVESKWAGAKSYRVAPTALGEWDGIIFDGLHPEYISQTLFSSQEPEGCIINGGDFSYNSRHGIYMKWAGTTEIVNLYGEGNKGKDAKLGDVIGSTMSFETVGDVDITELLDANNSEYPTRTKEQYPNTIYRKGRYIGSGIKSLFPQYKAGSASAITNISSITGSFGLGQIGFDLNGFPKIEGSTPNHKLILGANISKLQSEFTGDTFSINAPKNLDISPVDNLTLNSSTSGIYCKSTELHLTTSRSAVNDRVFASTTKDGYINVSLHNGTGESSNAAATIMRVSYNNSTGRSINAKGTVNASGTDYAEYMTKAASTGAIEKGDICGINKDGLLTDKWSDAVSFVIKSTNPSYVGGDVWGDTEDEAELEQRRQKVDRIAFSGQVPVNITEFEVGDYLTPTKDGEGITCVAISNPSFEQYRISIGRVVNKLDDGRANVIVKVS